MLLVVSDGSDDREVPLSPTTRRALGEAGLRLAEANQGRVDAIVAAHLAGASIGDIARELKMDAFDVRDVLARAGELQPLPPKESALRPR